MCMQTRFATTSRSKLSLNLQLWNSQHNELPPIWTSSRDFRNVVVETLHSRKVSVITWEVTHNTINSGRLIDLYSLLHLWACKQSSFWSSWCISIVRARLWAFLNSVFLSMWPTSCVKLMALQSSHVNLSPGCFSLITFSCSFCNCDQSSSTSSSETHTWHKLAKNY
jgi:hypothetical protein